MIVLGMVLLHCSVGLPPVVVIHVMVLVWSKDPKKPRKISASRVIVQIPGQKAEGDCFPLKRLYYLAERNRKRAKKVLSLLAKMVGHWW